jgi:predicted nucleotidyltransferase
MGRIVSRKRALSFRHQQALDYAIKKIKDSEFAKYVEDIYLFGSCARQEAQWNSDVDICMILNPGAGTIPDFSRKIHLLKGTISEEALSSAETDLKIVFGNDWKNSRNLFYHNIRRDGVSVWR